MADNLVGYSRAGDEFHYRWAARRCLRMLFPNSKLTSMFVEGSDKPNAAGEYVMDVTEYALDEHKESVAYFQLKHTTVQKDKPFQLSDLQDTFTGFSARFAEHSTKGELSKKAISFSLITNRPVDLQFKENLRSVASGEAVNKRFLGTLKKYTSLDDIDIKAFCSTLIIEDGHGDYQQQKRELKVELSRILVDFSPNTQVENITALVKDRVLPNSNGKILREDILERFGISSEKDLNPAEAAWEELGSTIRRSGYRELISEINSSSTSVIVHAEGGVGKSVFTRHFIESIPEGSVAIGYDCFGAGRYRNPSETRHRHREAMMQITNELATMGLCEPLLVSDGISAEREITRMLLYRLEATVQKLREAYPSATLTILIDAADNAEMAAKEFNQNCFASELLREQMPEGCTLVYLCRPERIFLLQPQSFVRKLELKPFSKDESWDHLKTLFPKATETEGVEFHRLTTGNPRVQSNAMDNGSVSVSELLNSLGPKPTSVEDQIQAQLESAVNRLKDLLPTQFHHDITRICTGLASLSPNIPIDVLSLASGVPVASVKSFVSDIGRPLWLTDSTVQFRDEPTESWFKARFCGNAQDFENYLERLEPLAQQSAYVSEILPQLYLQAGKYEKLISIALSDDFLPNENPIDARNIRVYRLQFAFRAALKAGQTSDAVKLAMRAGEEVAGDERQSELLMANLDLLAHVQSREKVREIAFKRVLSGSWTGSENIYSAALLSDFPEYQGEARGYLRSSLNWLSIYFDSSEKQSERDYEEKLQDRDILQIALAKLKLDGVKACTDFLNRLKPKEAVFRIVGSLAKSLIDLGSFDILKELLKRWKSDAHCVIAITAALFRIGHVPQEGLILACLSKLTSTKTRIKFPDNINQPMRFELLAFLECCIYRGFPPAEILLVLNHYFPIRAERMVMDDYSDGARTLFMRTLAIRCFLQSIESPVLDDIMPVEIKKEKSSYELNQKKTEFTQIIEGLLPWYLIRIKLLSSSGELDDDELKHVEVKSNKGVSGRYKGHDPLPYEIAQLKLDLLIFTNGWPAEKIEKFYRAQIIDAKSLKFLDWLLAVSAAYRLPHLKLLSAEMEAHTYSLIKGFNDQGPDELAEKYIDLARAVLVNSKQDASVYFDDAIGIVSKFGEELIHRWEAIVGLARRSCEGKSEDWNEFSYRFIRVAEIVGEQKREKHWSRGEAIQLATRLSTTGGIAALSRWRERDVGRFEWLQADLIMELVRQQPQQALLFWSMTSFLHLEPLKFLVEDFLAIPTLSNHNKELILNDTVSRFRKENVSESYWLDLAKVGEANTIVCSELNKIITTLNIVAKNNDDEPISAFDFETAIPWKEIFGEADLLKLEGLSKAKLCFEDYAEKQEKHFGRSPFWQGVISQLTANDLLKLFATMELCDFVEHYDFQTIFGLVPPAWLNTASFKRSYPSVIKGLGRKYCEKLTNFWSFDYFVKALPPHTDNAKFITEGILEGFTTGTEFAAADVFFGFARTASAIIPIADAITVLDYSISRFELHLDQDYGDGMWGHWLDTDDGLMDGVAGYLWSSLGSPYRETRWRSCHCIVKMVTFGNVQLIKSLCHWLSSEKVGAFGSKDFPFYNLHARQYLFIAFLRISATNPEMLKDYANLFVDYALKHQHLIIQVAAAKAAKNIESYCPGTYTIEVISELNKVGVPIGELKEKYGFYTDSYLHASGQVPIDLDFHSAYDFDRYWFAPLGRIFGVSAEQLEDIVADVVVNQWKITNGGYNNDPRIGIWNRNSRSESTHHSHTGFPKADNLDFYHSYHGMMVAASGLISHMPVISSTDWDDERWDNWLQSQFLTLSDGTWLSDHRNKLPLKRPDWTFGELNKEWEDRLTDRDYLESVIQERDGKKHINVKGWWNERKNSFKESYYITSALVSVDTADSLFNALETCMDTHDFKLPSYLEEDMEVESIPFKLQGWLYQGEVNKGLDQFDPFAKEVLFPPISIGQKFIEELGLEVCKSSKRYKISEREDIWALAQSWVSEIVDRDDQADQSGQYLSCSLDFIQLLCRTYKASLILMVQLERSYYSRYGSSSDSSAYKPVKHKMFLINEDGEIKYAGGNSAIGETVSQ